MLAIFMQVGFVVIVVWKHMYEKLIHEKHIFMETCFHRKKKVEFV